MTNTQLVTLGSASQITEALMKVNDATHVQQKLYPKLTSQADQQKYPMGVLLLIELALHDYCNGLPPMMHNLLSMQVPEFIKCLVPDPEEQKLVLEEYAKLMTHP
jgi:hypothetical protein